MSSNDSGQLIHSGQVNAMASHVSEHFALAAIGYDLRADSEEGWRPAVTTEDLVQALEKVLKKRRSRRTPAMFVPVHPVLINEDGGEEFADVLRITDVNEKLNAVLVKLAEAIALQQASRDAMDAAVGLCVALGINGQD